MSSTTTTIKIGFDGQLRRLPKASGARDFASLAQDAADLFHINDAFVFEWRDADGDVIVMSSDAELDEAFAHAQDEGWKTLRLTLRKDSSNPTPRDNTSPRSDELARTQPQVSPRSESEYVTVQRAKTVQQEKKQAVTAKSDAPPSVSETKQNDSTTEAQVQDQNGNTNETEHEEPTFDWSILHQLHQVLPLLLGSEEAHLVLEIIRQHAIAVMEQDQQQRSDQDQDQEQQKRQEAEAEEQLRSVLLPVVSSLLQVHPALVPPLRRLLASPAVQRVLHSTEAGAGAETDLNTATREKEQQEQKQEQEKEQDGPFAGMAGCPTPLPLLFAMMGGDPGFMGGPCGPLDPCGSQRRCGTRRGIDCPLPLQLQLLFAMREHDGEHGLGLGHMFRSVVNPVLAVFQTALGEGQEPEVTNKTGNNNENKDKDTSTGIYTAAPPTPSAQQAQQQPVYGCRGSRPVYTLQYDDQEQERELDRIMQMAMEESLAQQAST